MQANWGSNYPRLLFIKKEVGPNNMLLVVQGVNTENWDSEQICPFRGAVEWCLERSLRPLLLIL